MRNFETRRCIRCRSRSWCSFPNYKQATICWLMLKKMGRPQPPTPIHCNNLTAVGIANSTVKHQRFNRLNIFLSNYPVLFLIFNTMQKGRQTFVFLFPPYRQRNCTRAVEWPNRSFLSNVWDANRPRQTRIKWNAIFFSSGGNSVSQWGQSNGSRKGGPEERGVGKRRTRMKLGEFVVMGSGGKEGVSG